jgi:ATP-dependent RNA helicase DeaD
MEFKNMGLDERICQALDQMGFVQPTEIQEKAIPAFLASEQDIIALAQTGTGKTAAYGLPILQNIDPNDENVQALIVSPTRELALQIYNDLRNFGKFLKGIRSVAVYGGSSITMQIRELRQGAQIVVATPGRLIDLLDRKAIKINKIRTVILDEADEMLNMGFREDIENILGFTPAEKKVGLFSATMSPDIRKIANTYLSNPIEITIGHKNSASTNISHQYAVVQAKHKYAALKRIIDFNPEFYGIVFCTTKMETQDLSDHLVKEGYHADCLHGDLAQAQREKVMLRFRHKSVQVLMATDVAARGIDVKNLTHIIHYHLPDDIENYTHRSGRTARAGQKGISIALLHSKEAYKLHQIEKIAKLKFERYTIPSGEELMEARIQSFIAEFVENDEEKVPVKFKNEWIWPLMKMEQANLIQKILERELSKYTKQYVDAPDLNLEERSPTRTSSGGLTRTGGGSQRTNSPRSNHSGDVRLFVNLGKKDNLKYDEIREIIFKQTKVSGRAIRDIEMKGVYSFFMTDAESAAKLVASSTAQFKGRPVRIQEATEQKEGRNEHEGGGGFERRSEGKKPHRGRRK